MTDLYKCVKVPLNTILKDTTHIDIIENAVQRANKITIKAYQLVRLWILDQYHKQKKIPHINKGTFKNAFRVIKDNKREPKHNQLYQQMKSLFWTTTHEDALHLGTILDQYTSTQMLTAFETNIKVHYIKHLCRFVNSIWKIKFKTQLENKTLTCKLLKSELKKVKRDLIDGSDTADKKYKKWIQDVKQFVIPADKSDKGYPYDVKVHPQRFLPCMIWMNLELEKVEGKMFQCSPLRSNIIPKFLHFDSDLLINLLIPTKEKKEFKGNTLDPKIRKKLWTRLFNTKSFTRIESKSYVFDHGFMTDGYNASLRFIHIDEYKKQLNIKKAKKKGLQELKGKTEEEKKKIRAPKEKKKKEFEEKQEKRKKEKKKTKKTKKTKIPEKPQEFLYIDEVPLETFKNKKIVVVDPGKRDLMAMLDSEGEWLSYSNRQYINGTKRLKYQRLLQNLKSRMGILKIEQASKLSSYNSKTCDLEKFKEYLKIKTKLNEELFDLYTNMKFRQYKWYSFINRERTENKMLDLIEKTFGGREEIVIVHGDWSQGKQMRNFISTPNLGIKRKLKKRFEVYNIDEFRTSKLHHKTLKKCENLRLPDKKGRLRKQHAILTYKMENKRMGCLNRDKNACMNMMNLMRYFLKTNGGRIPEFSRSKVSTKVEELKKEVLTNDGDKEMIAIRSQVEPSLKTRSVPAVVGCTESENFEVTNL